MRIGVRGNGNQGGRTGDTPPPEPLARRTVAIALIVALAQFMQMLDSAVISVALPGMAHDFGTSPVAVGFGVTVYVLAAAVVIPASAWLADRLGARSVFVGALAAFALSSVLCGQSATLPQFIGARALQGIAGALMAPVGQVILLRTVERHQLLRIMTLTSAPMLVAPVIGPPLGGFLATWLGWPWIFYINVLPSALAIVLALNILPNPRGDRRPFDATGFLLNAAALTPLLWGLSEMSNRHVSRAVAGLAIAVGLLLGWAALRHARRAAHPLLSLAPLRHLTYRLTSSTSTILIRLPVVTLMFVVPILLQSGFGMTPFLTGLLLLWHSGGDLAMKLFTTRVFRFWGYRTTLLACVTGMAVAIGGAALFTPGTPLVVIGAVLFVSGCFRSFVLTGLSTLAFSDIERPEMAGATTLNQVTTQLTTALGVSAASLLFAVSGALRGASGATPDAGDCRIALAVMACAGLAALPLLRRLPADAGRALSGHQARTAAQAEE